MAEGLKRNETRSWQTSYRGELAIHAAKRQPRPQDYPVEWLYLEALKRPAGAVLCVVDLVGCVRAEDLAPTAEEAKWGDYSPGRCIWVTRNCRPLREPWMMIGHQGLWEVADLAEVEIRKLL